MRSLLPDFVVIGAEKAGTSSLHVYLADHPDIFMPAIKEIRFFDLDQNFARGVDWYGQFFRPGLGAGAMMFGEASPGYLHFPKAAERMRTVVPDARLIVLLRDPVKRAYSHHWNRVRGGHERRTFHEVVTAHVEGRAPSVALDAGCYADHLERFFRVYPREQIHIAFTDALATAREAACRDIFGFLGVDVGYVPRTLTTDANVAALPRSRWVQRFLSRPWALKRAAKRVVAPPVWLAVRRGLRRLNSRRFAYPPMGPATQALLRGFYEESDKRLRDLIGVVPWRARDEV